MPRITVSFKHNKEDLELYNEIMKHSDRSGFVKDVMKGNMPAKGKEEPEDDMLRQLKGFNFAEE
jgi:hypothetical protein